VTAEPYAVHWTDHQAAVVVLPEHIDLSNTAEIRSELLSVINRGATVLIVDMTATISCDHSGGDAVARAYQRAVVSGTDLRLVVTSQIVRRMLSIGGIDRLVSVYPSVEAALAAGTPGAPALGPAPCASSPRTEIALLDRHGVIESVNDAWQAFAAANQGDPARVGQGISYLEVCSAAGDDPVAQEVGAAIRQALAGDLPEPLAVELPCHSPGTARWFDMLISARRDVDGSPLGATVTLSLSRSQPRTSPATPGHAPRLRRAEEHDRIDPGMSDLLVQKLFSAGLSLQTALAMLGDHPAAGQIQAAISTLDLAVRDFRSFLFEQPVPGDRGGTPPNATSGHRES
jgi:anti-anti-sigma factor